MTTTHTDATAEKLAEILTENTGRSILDSGDYYGRHWEHSQGADFERQPEGRLEFWHRDGELDILPVVNVYHFLKDRLEYNPELDERYREYVEQEALRLDLRSAESFVNTLDGKGLYGDDSGPFTVNTYNGEDLLSQTLQYVYWTDDDGAHVMLQIHGGCDVRGGYTAPVAFDVADYDGTSIFDNARASVYCEDCGKHWDSDDGCHWLADGCSGQRRAELQDYPATDERPDYPEPPNPAQLTLPIDLPQRPEPCAGVVWADDERNGHCPFCGGLLYIAPWPAG
ncbi:MAG: hypothetical protein ACYTG0_07150 [Planctomycetota bacterium]|jgi:hypothetical protein